MLKKVIKYVDYDGNEQETVAYFNLSKIECMDIDLEYEAEGGLVAHLKKLFANKKEDEISKKEAVDFIKFLIDRSYGVRPKDDPTLFLKEDDNGRPMYKRFRQTPAYSTFVYDLLSGKESLDDFASGIMPYVPEADLEAAKDQLRKEGFSGAALGEA